ncbi:hypothetical protein JCM19314_686 [Nonlabens ulvanivorans]|uniref:Uncharacterized protein n=1 Tax=Nonlabens ulvanivorans TaxID=906888 RepID=A0A090R0L3_NONUL|nr:hypothetical protein [Nonlabens ulvanivorans]GAL01242.1 hypothetical protein JCM19314_686 [Nonlabens ulvanivorans]
MDTNDNLHNDADGNLENVNNTDQNTQDMPEKDMNTEPSTAVEETKVTPQENVTSEETTETPVVAVKEEESTSDNDDESDDHAEDVDAQTLPDTDYNTLEMPALVASLRQLIQDFPINTIKTHVDDIKKAFESKDQDAEKEAREEFVKANPATEEAPAPEFEYDNPISKEFNDLHSYIASNEVSFNASSARNKKTILRREKTSLSLLRT